MSALRAKSVNLIHHLVVLAAVLNCFIIPETWKHESEDSLGLAMCIRLNLNHRPKKIFNWSVL